MKMVCKFLWDFGEAWWELFGFDIFAPVKLLFPHFGRWLFQGMTGLRNGKRIDK